MNRLTKYELFDFLELLVGSIAFVASVLTIFNALKQNTFIESHTFLITIAAIFLVTFIKLLKLRKIAYNRLKTFSETFHNFTDKIRNEMATLQTKRDNNELQTNDLENSMVSVSGDVVNMISKSLEASTGEKITTCIKYFPDRNNITWSVENLETELLCSCSNTSESRRQKKAEKVCDNTALATITFGRAPHFATSNVEKFDKMLYDGTGISFSNPSGKWREHYNALIVTPIRIKKSIVQPQNDAEGFDLMGFIWVESKSTSAFRKKEIDCYTHFIKAFSDELYKYFDKVFYYLQNPN